jgi:hypothetical protein
METYYLSYNPNDFFWVSVSGEYDLSKCEDMIRPKPKVPLGMKSALSLDTSNTCPCAITTPPPTASPPSQGHIRALNSGSSPSSGDSDADLFYRQVCANYVYSKDLQTLQKQATGSDRMVDDIREHYFSQVVQIVNICIGVAAMALVARSS